MSTVTIDGQTTSVFDAIQWCSKNFGQTWGELKHQFPGWHWQFRFKDHEQAMMFALKWS